MEQRDILAQLQDIFRDVFDNDGIVISNDTVAEDIEEWDSLAHVQLTKEIENKFMIKISSKELLSWDNVGEMVESIYTKL